MNDNGIPYYSSDVSLDGSTQLNIHVGGTNQDSVAIPQRSESRQNTQRSRIAATSGFTVQPVARHRYLCFQTRLYQCTSKTNRVDR